MDNFDDLSLAVKNLECRADMLESFIARLLAKLIANNHIQPNELNEVIKSLEADFPYPKEGMTFENTALRYLCQHLFSELPDLQTSQYKKYYK